MSSTFEKLSSNKGKLNFTVSAEEFEQAIKTAYAKTAKKYNVPGFRRGKAPRHIIELHYGEGVFYEAAFDELFPTVYKAAIAEHDVKAVDRPELDVQQIGRGQELKFTAEMYISPDVVLGDYSSIEAEKVVSEVTDDDVSAELERARERVARFVDVTDRPAQLDDQVNIDYAGFDGDRQFEGGTDKGHALVLGSGSFIPGFEEQLVGHSVGEELDVNVTFPEEYHEKSLAGKPVVFKVKINGIQQKEIPALDDDFAKDVSEFDTLDAYKVDVRAKLTEQAEKRAETTFENEVVEKVVEQTQIDIPDAMIEDAIDNIMRDFQMRMAYQGMRMDDYLKYTGQTAEQMREMYKDQAAQRVKTQLTLEAIRDKEAITATDEEVEKEIEKLADERKKSVEDIKKSFGEGDMDYFRQTVCMQKVVDLLKGNAR